MASTSERVMATLLFFQLVYIIRVSEAVIVQTKKGPIRGFQKPVDIDGQEKTISTFLGVPFAKPPVGELRFEPPEEPDPWGDIYNTTDFPPQCIQLDAQLRQSFPNADRNLLNQIAMSYGKTIPSEDCLYLNVYVPRATINSSESLPVMVWIHDGGGIVYSANVNDGTHIALEGDIIAVGINYRLVGLGFLAVQDSEGRLIRSNLAFQDQVLAIQWVKDNIAMFGGDPDAITLVGTSAGALAIGAIAVSPETHGLVHRLIATSGFINHIPWFPDGGYKAASRYFINLVGCGNLESDALMRCLKSLPVEVFSGAPQELVFGPVQDTDNLPIHGEQLLKTGQIHSIKEAMLGSVSGEGTFRLNREAYAVMNDDIFQQMLEPFAKIYSQNNHEQIMSLLRYEYVTAGADRESYQKAFREVHADSMLSTVTRNLKYMIDVGIDVYQFYFTHQSSDSSWPSEFGASHGSDVKFVLPRSDSFAKATPEELAMGKIWRRAWSNFVKTGNPNPITDDGSIVWKPYTTDTRSYLEIDTDMTADNAKEGLHTKRMTLWNDVIMDLADQTWDPTSEECPDSTDGKKDKNPQVELQYGLLEGKQMSENDQKWEEYLGIPYATPPLGLFRWRKPEPPLPWEGVWNAKEFRAVCLQKKSDFGLMNEDCLYMNIYVPRGVKYVRYLGLPVMVYIHGGAFKQEAGSNYPGQYLAMHGDVIVVTFNYRLGALGFITTFDWEFPGNYGMWDQNQAIKWVKENIEQFGGDPDRITLFGQSAGGASVAMHMLSPHSKDLIQGAILQSGTPYSPFAFLDRESLLSLTHNLADHFDCLSNSTSLMMNCLRAVNASELVAAPVTNGPGWAQDQWSPVIDGDFFNVNTTDNDAFASTVPPPKIPLMVGYLHDDAAAFVGYGQLFKSLDQLRLFIGSYTKQHFREPEVVAAATEYVYITEEVENDEATRMTAGMDMATDNNFRAPSVKFAKDFINVGGEVYFYTFRHHTSTSTAPASIEGKHGEDLLYVLGLAEERGLSTEEVQLSKEMMTYWTNFAHSGDPNKPVAVSPEWPQFTPDSQEHIEFGEENKVLNAFERSRQLNFWADVVPALEGPLQCLLPGPAPPASGGKGGNGSSDEPKDTDDEDEEGSVSKEKDSKREQCDDDELKPGIIVTACLAGGSILFSLIMLCYMCRISNLVVAAKHS